MRKITMKRKNKTAEITKNSEEDVDEPQPQDDEGDSNVGQEENGTSKKNKNRRSKGDVESEVESDEGAEKRAKKKSKKGRKVKIVEESNGTGEEGNAEEEEYEVEQVIDHKMVKGAKFYLIRWKGYGEESDTWEPESTLDCPELVAKYENSRKDDSGKSKKDKKRSKSSGKSPKRAKIAASGEDEEEEEKVGEYEVDRILEVYYKKNGKREFLVHWKGYNATDNTWEPEENMSCHDLIERFMERVNKARSSDSRELRVNRKPTKHFTLSMQQTGRRLSRRNIGKQRAQYKELD